MNFKIRVNFLVFLVALLLSINLMGCTRQGTNPPPTGRTTQKNRALDNNNAKNITKNTTPGDNIINKPNQVTHDLTKRADKIANNVSKIKGVKNAKVLISNNRALVGIDIGAGMENKMTDNLKKEVENIVKKTDKNIKSVAVSADADIFKRISNIGEGIRSGKPLSQFANEVEEIFRRIIPR